ncbi:HNH endonuclease [bacterium]|nr:HNH endonuclease [bacterium]
MNDITNKLLTLKLNANWQAMHSTRVRDAVCDLCSSDYEALDIDYDIDDNGEYDFSSPLFMNPVKWDEWIKLPIRDFDFSISSPHMTIRVPTVMIAKNFSKMPVKKPKLSKHSIYNRDNSTCQYSGKKITRNSGNIDHVMPISKGGKDTWDNMVFCSRDINLKKMDKTIEEAGLKLIREPKEPQPMPISALIKKAAHCDWKHFIVVHD